MNVIITTNLVCVLFEPAIPTLSFNFIVFYTCFCSLLQPLSQRSNCCRSRKCIRWHIPVHAILPFFIYFSYLFYLGHLSLLGHQTKTRRQSNSSTFCSFKSYNPETFMSSAATAFVHATLKRSQKVPRAKSGTFWFPRMDSHDSSTIP